MNKIILDITKSEYDALSNVHVHEIPILKSDDLSGACPIKIVEYSKDGHELNRSKIVKKTEELTHWMPLPKPPETFKE